jgi:hypothetical protein
LPKLEIIGQHPSLLRGKVSHIAGALDRNSRWFFTENMATMLQSLHCLRMVEVVGRTDDHYIRSALRIELGGAGKSVGNSVFVGLGAGFGEVTAANSHQFYLIR